MATYEEEQKEYEERKAREEAEAVEKKRTRKDEPNGVTSFN